MTEVIEIDSGSEIQVVVNEATSEAVVINENANLSLFVPQSHSLLLDLDADDHTQYHNNARGDIRYYLKAQVDALLAGYQPAGNYITALTGEASATGGGSVPITLSNAAVIAKTISGFASAAGTLSAADSLLAAIQKLDGNVGLKADKAITISTTTPLAGGGDLSANRTLSIADAAADGTTKGAATFAAADFNATAGLISIDYTNGQAATGSVKGFLTAADWTTFNAKQPAGNYITSLTGEVTASGAGAAAATVSNAAVIAKVLTGFASAAGAISAADSLLSAIQKLDGNDGLKAPIASPTFTGNVIMSTAGSYLIIGASSLPASAPNANLYITDTAGLEPMAVFDAFANSGNITVQRANGTAASPTALASADVMVFFGVKGYYSTGGTPTGYSGNVGALRFLAAEAYTNTGQGNYFEIATTAIGATTRAQRAKFDEGGVTSSQDFKLPVGGYLSINGNAIIYQAGTSYTILQAYNGTGSIQLGNLADPQNYYNNGTHVFRNLATSTTYLTIGSGVMTLVGAYNIAVDTTTGTKIGTATSQKLSLWNATPIVQPTTAIAAATFVANAGTAVNDASTFDGYTIKQMAKALRNFGLLA